MKLSIILLMGNIIQEKSYQDNINMLTIKLKDASTNEQKVLFNRFGEDQHKIEYSTTHDRFLESQLMSEKEYEENKHLFLLLEQFNVNDIERE